MSKIYLASPLFTPEEKKNVKTVANYLRKQGHEVFVPMEHQIENAWSYTNAEWAEMVFQEDKKGILDADFVVAIVYGMTDDAGTAWEIGFSYGIGKKVYVLPVNSTTYSLMIRGSASEYESQFFADDIKWENCLFS